MKSNMEYLREFIEDNDAAVEFWDAVSKEIEELNDELKEFEDANIVLTDKNDELSRELDEYIGKELIEEDSLITVDCGIGEIKYLEPENLKLQGIMEDFKEKMEHKAFFA